MFECSCQLEAYYCLSPIVKAFSSKVVVGPKGIQLQDEARHAGSWRVIAYKWLDSKTSGQQADRITQKKDTLGEHNVFNRLFYNSTHTHTAVRVRGFCCKALVYWKCVCENICMYTSVRLSSEHTGKRIEY